MLRKDQYTEPGNCSNGRKENRRFVRRKIFSAGFIFTKEPIHNEQAVVITQAKYQRRNNDINNVEGYTEHPHNTQNPYPGNKHRDKGNQDEFNTPVSNK